MHTSYTEMARTVDLFFPPIDGGAPWARGDTVVDFDRFGYWREPVLELKSADLTASLSEDELALLRGDSTA